MRLDTSLIPGKLHLGFRGVGLLGSQIPTGFANPSLLEPFIDAGFPSRLYWLQILTGPTPAGAQLNVNEDGSGTLTSPTPGTYTGTMRVSKFDSSGLVSNTDQTYSFTVSSGVAAALDGAAVAVASGSSVLSTAIRLVGAAVVVASGTGALSTSIPLSGSATATASATGQFAGQAAALVGAAVASAAGTGSLTTSIPLVGAAAAVASASSQFSGQAATLVGVAQAVASGTGNLITSVSLAGAAVVSAGGSGTLATAVPLVGSAFAVASGSGQFSGQAAVLAGVAQAVASGAGALSTAVRLSGAASAAASGTGALSTAIVFTGTASAVSYGLGTLTNARIAYSPSHILNDTPLNKIWGSTMTNLTSAFKPRNGGQPTADKDPDDIDHFGVSVAAILAENPGAEVVGITPLCTGVLIPDGEVPRLQDTDVVALFAGGDTKDGAENFCTFRILLSNGVQRDRTIYFRMVNK
jgi:hypothetical protein